MGLREWLLILVLPLLVLMIFSSFQMIEQQLQQHKISRFTGIGFRYLAIICPPIAFIILLLRKAK